MQNVAINNINNHLAQFTTYRIVEILILFIYPSIHPPNLFHDLENEISNKHLRKGWARATNNAHPLKAIHINDMITPKSQSFNPFLSTEHSLIFSHLQFFRSDTDAPSEPLRGLLSCDASAIHAPIPRKNLIRCRCST
ncbi:hypothetical protein I7I53_11378 [Histoplasma capsulatum var. duboisii H88]|uniref:Uncharacterized protein n=1 Tax=Ajellomyces capsulatus (strain H88) TaxID=544711 RepID=A0A8A1LAG2_AJEC8|nr:hypothetical protein I7I53_11378 [Histoplasma capsulatum var. duboisii H88]